MNKLLIDASVPNMGVPVLNKGALVPSTGFAVPATISQCLPYIMALDFQFDEFVHPFAVPGIIPLTLIDANTVHTAIQRLSTIPALTTALRLRVEGVGTRASGPGQGPSDDQPPSFQVTAQAEEQSTSQSVDQSAPAEQQQVETEPFPGSSSLDW